MCGAPDSIIIKINDYSRNSESENKVPWQTHFHEIIWVRYHEIIRKGCPCHPERCNSKDAAMTKTLSWNYLRPLSGNNTKRVSLPPRNIQLGRKKKLWKRNEPQALQEHEQTRKKINKYKSSRNSSTPPPQWHPWETEKWNLKKKTRAKKQGSGKQRQDARGKKRGGGVKEVHSEALKTLTKPANKVKCRSSWTVIKVNCGNAVPHTLKFESAAMKEHWKGVPGTQKVRKEGTVPKNCLTSSSDTRANQKQNEPVKQRTKCHNKHAFIKLFENAVMKE